MIWRIVTILKGLRALSAEQERGAGVVTFVPVSVEEVPEDRAPLGNTAQRTGGRVLDRARDARFVESGIFQPRNREAETSKNAGSSAGTPCSC